MKLRIFILFTGLLAFTQCKDYFKTETNDVLSSNDYIKSVDELYAGFRGIAAKMQAVGDQSIFVTELRGDLLEPTATAPQELWDIYNYKADTSSNSLLNPKGYYNIIINANDYIIKALKFKNEHPNAIADGVFQPLVSGAIRFKCWAYLMLAKTYGKAFYFDDALTEYTNISNYEVLTFDALIQRCLTLMSTGVDGIDGKQALSYKTILSSTDLIWDMVCPTPEALQIELNLWAGNYQTVVDLAIPYIYDNGSATRYKLTNKFYNGEWYRFFYYAPQTVTDEVMTVIPYNYTNNQTNKLNPYFGNTFSNKYYLKPTAVAMARFNSQLQYDGATMGDKYRGDGYTFEQINGDWVIRKFSKSYETSASSYKNDEPIVLYRASDIHLFLAEALNQLELFPEAEAFLNDGVGNYTSKFANGLRAPLNNSVYNVLFANNLGVRRRVNLSPAIQSKVSLTNGVFTDTLNTRSDTLAYKKAFDIALVEETCMESAGEARSYFAMMRVAKRWNDASILANRVSAKYAGDMKETIRTFLMTEENWFVNYQLIK